MRRAHPVSLAPIKAVTYLCCALQAMLNVRAFENKDRKFEQHAEQGATVPRRAPFRWDLQYNFLRDELRVLPGEVHVRMCPSNALSSPQQCSPGRFSTGIEKEYQRCSAGFFSYVHKATGCCPCAPGWFNVSGTLFRENDADAFVMPMLEIRIFNSELYVWAFGLCSQRSRCPNQTPCSDPGTPAMSNCYAKPGAWALSKIAVSRVRMHGTRFPHVAAAPSGLPKRHLNAQQSHCQYNERACPGYRNSQLAYFACMDVQRNLVSCGGCIKYDSDGMLTEDSGRDCSMIPFVSDVQVSAGQLQNRAVLPRNTPPDAMQDPASQDTWFRWTAVPV